MYCSGKETVRVAVIAREAGADGMPLAPPVGSAGITHFWEVEKYPKIWLDRIKAQLRGGISLPSPILLAVPLQCLALDFLWCLHSVWMGSS